MKITHGAAGVVNRELWAEYLGDRPVLRIIKNGEQIWPDPTDRVRRIIINPDALSDTYWSRIWNYATKHTQTATSSNQYMRFKFGGSFYFLNSTYAAYQKATYSTGGIITFNEGFGPLRSDVQGVESINVQILIPKKKSNGIKGESSIDIPPRGTQARMYWGKWQKKVSAACLTTITSMPSKTVLANVWGQSHGHERYAQDWLVHTFNNTIAGDTYITITSYSPNTSDYRAYLKYPAIKTTITLPILSIE